LIRMSLVRVQSEEPYLEKPAQGNPSGLFAFCFLLFAFCFLRCMAVRKNRYNASYRYLSINFRPYFISVAKRSSSTPRHIGQKSLFKLDVYYTVTNWSATL
ncbi:hypothetical protein ACUTRW_16225, partial [Serratia sp. TSA_166.4]|uniref:hypothetical protein n=1 Tax=Serratia sp. TSA_166.4 TaxID=3415663 RepID=UPI004045D6A6